MPRVGKGKKAAKRRREALADAIAYYESKNGKITEEDRAAVRVKWPSKG